jgi:hypothetical protein
MFSSGFIWTRSALALVAISTTSCVSLGYHTDAVTYGPGRDTFAGYSVDYGDATPPPGTSLVQGTTVRLTVRVRYSLQAAQQGRLALFFDDGLGLEGKGTAIDITRTDGRQDATLSYEFAVPMRTRYIVAKVGVFPNNAGDTSGVLRIKYPVVAPRRT